MKYLQLASVSTPAAVSTWFQDELVNRGVDAAYTFYVLSLLREDPDEVDIQGHRYSAKANEKPELQRLRAKRCAVECLKSAALEEDTTFENFDALVEELLARLEPPQDSSEIPRLTLDSNNNNNSSSNNSGSLRRKKNSSIKALTTTEATVARTTATTKTTSTATSTSDRDSESPTPAITAKSNGKTRSQQCSRQGISENHRQPKEEKTLAERAKKYFEAFPALQVHEFSDKKEQCSNAAELGKDSLSESRESFQRRSSVKIKNPKAKKRNFKDHSSLVCDEAGQRENRTDFKVATDKDIDNKLGNNNNDDDGDSYHDHHQRNCMQLAPLKKITSANSSTTSPVEITTSTNQNPESSVAVLESLAKISLENCPATDNQSKATSEEIMMGSIVHEESLVSSLTKKFDSRLAAIWADAAPVVEDQPSVWRISLDLTASGNRCAAEHDEVIFTIPHSMSQFSTILDDEEEEDDGEAPDHAQSTLHCSLQTSTNAISSQLSAATSAVDGNYADEHHCQGRSSGRQIDYQEKPRNAHDECGRIEQIESAKQQNSLLDTAATTNEAMGFIEAGELSSPPTLCLKNSTLNYDKENTAFTKVVPKRKNSSDSASSLPTLADVPSDQVAGLQDSNDGEDQDEDLLFSLRTHFTPIRIDIDDIEDAVVEGDCNRPLSSSLEELSSYHLPPEPPKRLNHKAKQLVAKNISVPELPAEAPATQNDVSKAKHDDVRSLWKMVEFEVPQPAVDGDVLGVAHYWQGTAVNSGVSKELLKEILDEEEELFKDIFDEAMRAASQTSSLTEDANTTSTGYDSYQDTSLEYCGATAGAVDGNVVNAEQPCSIEYLSHFSNGSLLSLVFDTPEVYDSAIVSSVRSIQDLQRQRKRQQKKPCTFYLEGNCRRTDCKFSHDLSNITCRFWEDNSCFKGLACPFLHGYAAPLDDDVSASGQQSNQTTSSGGSKKETKRSSSSKFTIDSEQDFPSLSSNLKSSSHLKISKKSYKKPGSIAPKKVAAGRRKKKKTTTVSVESVTKTTPSTSESTSSLAASDTKIGKKDQGALKK